MSPHANLNPSMTTRNFRDRLGFTGMLAILLMLLAGLPQPLTATIYNWNVTSGDWIVGSNWNPVAPAGGPAPGASHSLQLVNGTLATPATTLYNVITSSARVYVDLAIGEHNTLWRTEPNVIDLRITGTFNNAGLITSQNTASTFTLDVRGTNTNSGIIEAAGAGGALFLALHQAGVGGLNNSGGILRAVNGATLQLRTTNTFSNSINGGTLSSDAESAIQVGLDVDNKLQLNGVTVANHGTFINRQAFEVGTSSRSVNTRLIGGTSFTNAATGLVHVLNSGAGTTTNVLTLNADFNVGTGAANVSTFTNQGTLLIQNTSTRTNPDNPSLPVQNSTFSIATGSSFSNTGTVQVFHDTTTPGSRATAFNSAISILNQGAVHVRGNTDNLGASFTVAGAGNSYTQSGAGSSTLLERGGALAAPTVMINDGTLGGMGTVTGNTTIAANGTVAPGASIGTLEFVGNLTLQGTYDLEIDKLLGTSDLLAVTGILDIDGAVLDIAYWTYQAGEQSFLIATATGGIFGGFASVVAPANYTLSLQNNGTELWLAIPEPTSLAMLALGALGLLRRRRLVAVPVKEWLA